MITVLEDQVPPGPVPLFINATEALALKMAMGMIARGELPLPGMSMVCIFALARLTNFQSS